MAFRLVALLSLAATAHAGEWYLALKSRVKSSDDFMYDSDLWTTGTPLNENDNTDTVNVLTSYYSTVYVESFKVELNGEEYEFNIPASDRGKFTLKDLVTMDGGYTVGTGYGWSGTTGNYFGYDSDERTAYKEYCHEFGFNYMAHENMPERVYYYSPKVRIGVIMDDNDPCYYSTTAEGIGMTANYGAYELNSGRLQWSGPWTFSAATVHVFGQEETAVEETIFFTAWWNYPDGYQRTILGYNVFDKEDIIVPYTITWHVQIKRTNTWWGNQLQVQDASWERSPGVWFYPNYNPDNYYSLYPNWEHSYFLYTGRRFHVSFKSTASNYDSMNSQVSIPQGKWTHAAVVAYMDHLVLYINGHPQILKEINGELNPLEQGTPWMSNTAWHAQSNMYGMRWYPNFALRTEYLQEQAAEWPPLICSDGERQLGEECDDGNDIDGDGCSSSCEVEAGFVCDGQTGHYVGTDRCEEGSYAADYAFDSGLPAWTHMGEDGGTWETTDDGYLRINNRKETTGETYTYAEFSVTNLAERAFLEYSMKPVKTPANYYNLMVTVYETSAGTVPPDDCHTSPYCDDIKFYRMCYQRRHWRYCDEVLPDMPTGSWTTDTMYLATKFYEKYTLLPSELPTDVTIQFAMYTSGSYDDSEGEMLIDNVRVGVPDNNHDYHGITVESYAYGGSPYASMTIDGVEYSENGAGFNVLLVDGATHQPLAGATSFDTSQDFADYVLSVAPGVVVLAATRDPLDCDADCADALYYIGGHGYSGATGSMAIIGYTKGNHNAVPFRIAAELDPAAKVHSMVRFHHVNDTLPEHTHQYAPVGFPVRVDEERGRETEYQISNYQNGYLGCYRVGSTRELGYRCYHNWGYTSPASCNKCCGKKGYIYFSLWYYYGCYCGDTYGSNDCDFSGECGIPRVHDKWCTKRRTYGDLAQTSGNYYYEAVYLTTGRATRLDTSSVVASYSCNDAASSSRCDYAFDGSTSSYYRSNNYDDLATADTASIDVVFDEVRTIQQVRLYWRYTQSGRATGVTCYYKLLSTDTEWTEFYDNQDSYNERYYDVIWGPTAPVAEMRIEFNAPGTGSYYELREIDFGAPSDEYWGQNLPMDQDHLPDDYFWEYYRAITHATGAHFKGNEAWKANEVTGQAAINVAILNYEVTGGYVVGIVAYEDGYDSDWFTMTANQGADSFVELAHGLDTRPDWVHVQAKSQSTGFSYQGIGMVQHDGRFGETYGGLLFAYNEDNIRLWAPTSSDASVTGYIINVQNGWGGEEQAEAQETADVRVTAFVAPAPDFDTGWFEMVSQDASEAVRVIRHDGGDLLHSRVKVMVKPQSGENEGYVFEASGTAQTDDDAGTYGGVLFAYDDEVVRIWAPVRNDLNQDNCPDGYIIDQDTQDCDVVESNVGGFGHIVNVPDGWAHSSTHQQVADVADVRFQIWVLEAILHMPYGTAQFDMSANGLAFTEHYHGFESMPVFVKCAAIADDGVNANFHFEGVGSGQGTDWRPKKEYGGTVFAYDDNWVRVWAPGQSSNDIKHAYGSLILASDGWGNGTYAQESQGGVVRVLAYKEYYGMIEYSYVNVTVKDINEYPNAALISVELPERTEEGYQLGTIDSIDEDFTGEVILEVLESEFSPAFDIDGDGNVFIADAELLDFETTPYFDISLRLHNENLYVDTIVAVSIIDGNDPCTLWPPFAFDVEEESPKNTLVGNPINATDPDFGQSIIFSLEDHVTTFRIASCGGQLYVLDPVALDHEDVVGQSVHNITVWAIDDGPDAINTSAVVTITVTDINDEPEWLEDIEYSVVENSLPGTSVGVPLNLYAYDVDDGDYLNYSISTVANQVLSDDSDVEAITDDDPEDQPQLIYIDGITGNMTIGTIELNFEDADSIGVTVVATDGNPNGQLGTPNLATSADITIYIIDANDPPVWTDELERYIEENVAEGTTLDAPILANDEDVFDYVVYELLDDAGGLFELDSESGVISLASGAELDYEAQQVYYLPVEVHDHGILTSNGTAPWAYVSGNVTVSVIDMNEAPTIYAAEFNVSENSPVNTFVGTELVATDPDVLAYEGRGQSLSFSIVDGNTDDTFYISSATGQIYVNIDQIDYEGAVQQYVLTVRVTDDGAGALTDENTVTINVLDENDAPAFNCNYDVDVDGYCDLFEVREGSVQGEMVGTVSATDPEGVTLTYRVLSSTLFEIPDGTDYIQVATTDDEALDSETNVDGYYDLEVETTDTSSDPMPETTWFRVELLDVDEPPAVKDCQLIVSNEADIGDPVGNSIEIAANPYYPDRDMDPDEYSVLSFHIIRAWRQSDDSAANGVFRIDAATGQVYVEDNTEFIAWNPLADEPLVYYLDVSVWDGANAGNLTARVNVSDLNNAPEVPLTYALSCEENTAAGTQCLPIIEGTDDDIQDYLTYTFVTGQDEFAIESVYEADDDQGHGVISVAFDNALNFEDTPEYTFDVLVTDSASELQLSAITTVTLSVVDVNDAPEASDEAFSVDENTAVSTVVQSVTWLDEDADALTFAITSSTDIPFAITTTGDASFDVVVTGDVDYESQTEYVVDVSATDPDGASDSGSLTISINDVNEAPELVAVALEIDENSKTGEYARTSADTGVWAIEIVDPDRDGSGVADTMAVTISAGDDANAFGIVLLSDDGHSFAVAVNHDSAVDYEDVTSYTLEIHVNETDTAEQLATTTTFSLAVNNVNDVTIERYDEDGDPESPFDVLHSTGLVPTAGGTRVNITGTNFGSMHTPEPVDVTFGATGTEYAAACEVVPGGNTQLTCVVPAGLGERHIWNVVTNPTTFAHGAASDAIAGFEGFFTAYQAPTVAAVELATSADGYMRTEGGDVLVITGTNFGEAADEARQHFGFAAFDSEQFTYLVTSETADGEAQCDAGKGFVELSDGDELAVSLDGAQMDPQELVVSQIVHPNLDGEPISPSTLRRAPCVRGDTVGSFRTALAVSGSPASGAFDDAWRVVGFVPPSVLLTNLPSMNEGDASPSASAMLEGVELRAEDCAVTVAHTEITCTVPAGVGLGFRVEVLVGGQASGQTADAQASYHPPIVTSILEHDVLMDTSGGDPMTLLGAFFGPAGAFAGYGNGLVEYGSAYGTYEAECTVWGSSAVQIDVVTAGGSTTTVQRDILNCTTAPGVSYDLPWEVTVGAQTSDPSDDLTSYKPPDVTAMPTSYWPFAETAGGNTVVLKGDEFGLEIQNVDFVRYGVPNQFDGESYFEIPYANCEITSSDAQEELTCLTVPGTGANHQWEMSVGGQLSNRFVANSSYAAPIVTDFEVPYLTDLTVSMQTALEDFDTAGYEPVVILGRNFGPMLGDDDYTSTYEPPIEAYAAWNEYEFPAVLCNVTVSHTELTCLTTAGVGTLLKWFVFIDYQESYVASTSYGPPDLFKVRGDHAQDAATVGGDRIRLIGENFGPCYDCSEESPDNFLEEVTYGADGNEYDVTHLCWVSVPHTEITCYTDAGVGKDLRFYITVGGQRMSDFDSENGPTMSYAPPNVTSIEPAEGTTTGGYVATVTGQNFGPEVSSRLQFWGKTMDVIGFGDEHDWATFIVPEGQHVGHAIEVTQVSKLEAHSQYSNADVTFNYSAPIIDRLITQEGSTRDSKLLTLHGQELDSLVTTGGHYGLAEQFTWTKDTGETETFANQVTVFAWGTELSTAVRCESTEYLWSHDEIQCEVDQVNGTLVVDVGGRWSNVVSFDNPSPIIETIELVEPGETEDADTLSTEGGATLTINGRYFEDDVTNVAIKLMSQYFDDAMDEPVRFMDNVLCPNLTLETLDYETKDGRLTCLLPPGQGENVVVKVVRGGTQTSDYTLESDETLCEPCFSYTPPDVTVYETDQSFPITAPTDGLGYVTLHGTNLGAAHAHVYVEGVELDVAAQTHDELSVFMPAGVGTDHEMVVSIGGQLSTDYSAGASADEMLTYDPPSVADVAADTVDGLLPTVGGTLVTITGENFGEPDASIVVGADDDSLEYPTVVALTEAFGKEEDGFVVMALYPDTQLPIVSWTHDEVVFVAPAGEGTDIDVSLSAGGQATTAGVQLSYRAPVLASRAPATGFTNGLDWDGEQTMITLHGSDFGTQGLAVWFDGEAVEPSFFNHSLVVFALPMGQGEDIELFVAVGGQDSNALSFDYRGPQLHWMDPVHGPTDGCHEWETKGVWIDRTDGMDPTNPDAARLCVDPVLITAHGRSLGHEGMTVMVGPIEAEWDCDLCIQNHTTAVFELPGYWGTRLNVTVEVEGRVSNGLHFDYDPPELLSSNPGSAGKEYQFGYANARGDFLTIAGNNLGAVETDINITISGIECLDAAWNEGGTDSADGQPYLTCNMQSDIVGAKNVTADVAGQSVTEYVRKTEINSLVVTICKEAINADQTKTQYYGMKGEVCLPCPEGAQCSAYEGYDDPWALAGFWREYFPSDGDDAADYCEPERRLSRDECPAFLPCEPEDACAGNNTCTTGYEYMIYECASYQNNRGGSASYPCQSDLDCDPNPNKECSYKKPYQCTECVFASEEDTEGTCECIPAIRCSLCTVKEYFKLDGKCEPCPSNPWVLIVGFACGAVLACVGGYVLNRRKFNLAFLSIGVDYFQILALFASADVAWPSLVLDIFRWMSLFNFNIDITAPECAMPDLQYEDKWQFIMELPLATAAIAVAAYLWMCFNARCKRGKRGEFDSDILVATYLVMFYYIYLTLTKKALDIFHCTPVEPDDGYTYAAFTSVNCETGLCRCWEPGGVQMTLFPWAVICFLVYSIGFPLTVAFIIFTNKTLIKEDQILRAKGLEHSRSTQKGSLADKAFHIRARYHKMYYHFKPGKIYWILLIINRKFWIALSGLMFADNPAFQFAVILLVLFMSYVMQVKHRPFMSTVEREAVVAAHQAKAETSRKHMRIANAVQAEMESQANENRLRKRGFSQTVSAQNRDAAKNYFWDYNTVEAYLLACAILICLAGIMFDASSDTDRDDIKAHRVFITYMTIIVIFFSLGYYMLVFCSEVFTTFGVDEWWITKKLMSKNAAADQANQMNTIDETEIETATNPMLAASAAALAGTRADEEARQIEMAELNSTNQALLEQLAAAKQREQMATTQGFGRRPKRKKEKKEFGQQVAAGSRGPTPGGPAAAPAPADSADSGASGEASESK